MMNPDVLKELNEQGEYFIAGHMRCESSKPILKYASGFRDLFSNCNLSIDTNCRLAPVSSYRSGRYTPIFNGLVAHPEYVDDINVQDQAGEYWAQYNAYKQVLQSLNEEERAKCQFPGSHILSSWQGHATINFERILEAGFVDYKKRVEAKRAIDYSTDPDKQVFYEALSIVTEGIEILIKRNINRCQEIIEEHEGEDLPNVKKLKKTFEQMLVGRPRDFFEAVQFTHFFNVIDGYDDLGRLDQYLYPFYKEDIKKGLITSSEAEKLLVEFIDNLGRHTHWQIVIGGLHANGTNAANELTTMIMNARHHQDKPNPSLSLRVSEKTPDEIVFKAFDLIQDSIGHPSLYNEEQYTREFEKIGVPHEDAVEFTFGGCTETHIAGKSAIRDSFLNIVSPLEAVLYNGHLYMDNARFGLKTGDPSEFKSFDAFFEAYKKQTEFTVDNFVYFRNKVQKTVAHLQPALIRSVFVDGCIEKGKNNSEGGTIYNHGMVDVYGVPTVANSLFAIKKLVFDEKKLTMNEFITALKHNFEGYASLRKLCLEHAKYGNDIDDVDNLTREVSSHVFSYIKKHRIWNGGIYYGFCATAPGAHMFFGETTGPTPDGRLASTPLANSMSAVQGTDTNGPLGLFNSLAKIELGDALGTPVVNISFSRDVFNTQNRNKLLSLIRTYFKQGGMHLQFSVVDKKILAEAMGNPDKHRNIFVRVSGYCARFVELPRDFQEEVALRTIHGV